MSKKFFCLSGVSFPLFSLKNTTWFAKTVNTFSRKKLFLTCLLMTVRLISFIKKALSGQYFEQTLHYNLPVEMKNSYQEVSEQLNSKYLPRGKGFLYGIFAFTLPPFISVVVRPFWCTIFKTDQISFFEWMNVFMEQMTTLYLLD